MTLLLAIEARPLRVKDKFEEHDAEVYLKRLAEVCCEQEGNRRRRIESSGRITKFFWAEFFWRPCAVRSGYKIERNRVTGAHRLISPAGLLLRVGSLEQCNGEISSLTKLDDTNSVSRIAAVDVLQDKFNRPEKVDAEGWETLADFHNWRLQRGRLTFRILDPRDYRRAYGSEEKMRKAFESVKEQWRASENK